MEKSNIDWNKVFESAKNKVGKGMPVEQLLDELWAEHVVADEEESKRGKELILWYIHHKGELFERKGGEWGTFMRNRPEVKEKLNSYFLDKREEIRKSGKKNGVIRDVIPEVDLRTEAMNLTLNIGSIFIEGSYTLMENDMIEFSGCRLTWKDDGDLHPGYKATGLHKYNVAISDEMLWAAEKFLCMMGYNAGKYPIKISWEMDNIGSGPMTEKAQGKHGAPALYTCRMPCRNFKRYGLYDRSVPNEHSTCHDH